MYYYVIHNIDHIATFTDCILQERIRTDFNMNLSLTIVLITSGFASLCFGFHGESPDVRFIKTIAWEAWENRVEILDWLLNVFDIDPVDFNIYIDDVITDPEPDELISCPQCLVNSLFENIRTNYVYSWKPTGVT